MGQYACDVEATTNTSANTEDTFMDLEAIAGQEFELKRIVISCKTAASDTIIRAKVFRKTAIGAGSVAGTEVKLNPTMPAPEVVATIKNGTSTYGVGTTTDLLLDVAFNARGMFEWVARDDRSVLKPGAGDFIGVNILETAASIIVKVHMEWEE